MPSGEACGKSREHSGAASEHDVFNEGHEYIDVTLGDALVDLISKATILNTCQRGVKHALCSLEALTSDLNDAAIW